MSLDLSLPVRFFKVPDEMYKVMVRCANILDKYSVQNL